ncbi:hypothetical protein RN001_011525 [Aquatica leii]|uniref:Uncharacterized protein n=1 Tax=Aquatica leii TaxID=1421715 RepID=A0AAN7QDX5_9COLE|nr:hypothetical protein RN001_011525 [Aquatica leii]
MSKKVTERFLKERYEKDDALFTVYDQYTANYFKQIITGKFYSTHDTLDLSKADMNIVDAIKRAKVKIPKNKYDWPVTESHRYGWYKPVVELDRQDRRFYCPVTVAPFITHEILLRLDKTMEKPKFVGIPFKL